MKKVLIITDMYPHKYNQVAGIFVQHQVEELAKRYTVHVVATCFPYKFDISEVNTEQIMVTRIYFPILPKFYMLSIISFWLYVMPQLKKVYKQFKPDILHVHDCRHIPELLVIRYWMKKIETAQYLTIHNIRTYPDRMKGNAFYLLYKITLGTCYRGWTHIFTVNQKLKQMVLPYNCGEAVTSIGNAIRPGVAVENNILIKTKSEMSTLYFNIISVGNLVREKGFDILIESISSLNKLGHKVKLVIIGDGIEKDRLKSLIKKLRMNEYISLPGAIDNDTVRNMYPMFDAFVLPSYSETFGIVYLEAMYAGLPIIGVRGQGIDGVVEHEKTGLLVNPLDLDDLIKTMKYLIVHTDVAKTISLAGRKLVQDKYMLSDLIDRIVKVYEN